ncbi:hypothetical protein CERSUDRAFT_114248 [Gelatoporia subvermispora B]|uniref:DUF1771 domain-containing protein n=1 Tax=Ceriporiopsis subvermispora (strain B) TaxID=914234 RepID=M2RFL1_CERS8|nr:hypothetical protein CERSUDRAFT_114248 [Gelatoporia subvermispora B]
MRKYLEQAEADRGWGQQTDVPRLLEQSNFHKREMERLNAEAAEWIFTENNKPEHCSPGEINLHSLKVQEAVAFTERALREAQQRGETEMHLVLGGKSHRLHHLQRTKLKHALKELARRYDASAGHDPYHDNVLLVRLDASGLGRSAGL